MSLTDAALDNARLPENRSLMCIHAPDPLRASIELLPIDGEVVVVHEGRTNFSELQAELAAGSTASCQEEEAPQTKTSLDAVFQTLFQTFTFIKLHLRV